MRCLNTRRNQPRITTDVEYETSRYKLLSSETCLKGKSVCLKCLYSYGYMLHSELTIEFLTTVFE